MWTPERGDWLYEHKELGQSFQKFVSHDYPKYKINREKKIVYLVPIGEFESDAPNPELLRKFLEIYIMPIKVVLLPTLKIQHDEVEQKVVIHNGFNKRKIECRMNPNLQILTGDVIDCLKLDISKDSYCLMGITTIDLYPSKKWNFVYGIAHPDERVGLFSFARHDPHFFDLWTPNKELNFDFTEEDKKLYLLRSMKTLVHEVLHLFMVDHCIEFQCVMNGSNSDQESDRSPIFLCPIDLHKLKSVSKCNLKERYEALLNFYNEINFTDESNWIKRRLTDEPFIELCEILEPEEDPIENKKKRN